MTDTDETTPNARAAPEDFRLPLRSRQGAELFREYSRTRDLSLRNQIVLRYEALARFAASRVAPSGGHGPEDLLQVAFLGLILSVERFDLSVGVEFRTFALPTIFGVMKHYLRDAGWLIKAPRGLRDLGLRIRRMQAELELRTGCPPTIAELATAAGVDEELVVQAMEVDQLYHLMSLDTPLTEEDGFAYGSVGEAMGSIDARLDAVAERDWVQKALARLGEREQLVLHHRFFDGVSQAETGRRLGISQMQVSRLERRAIARLREMLEGVRGAARPRSDGAVDLAPERTSRS